MSPPRRAGPPALDAVLLDLDGVLTATAKIHARAWKDTFDALLAELAEAEDAPMVPFDIEVDYRSYVDGKPRYDGVRSFLASRGIRVDEGRPGDPPGTPTVQGIGNRKNERFQELIAEEGVEVFEDVLLTVPRWREQGFRTAVVSSSKNCGPILRAAGLSHLFDAKVDGVDRERLGLPGKPAPHMFLEAARRLDVEPAHAAVVEDALAGVQAARAGGFGWVVGIARTGPLEPLAAHGADQVVRRLDELEVIPRQGRAPEERPGLR